MNRPVRSSVHLAAAVLLGLSVTVIARAELVTGFASVKLVDFSQFSGGFQSTASGVEVGSQVGESITVTGATGVLGNGVYGLGGTSGNGYWQSDRQGYIGLAAVTQPGAYLTIRFNDHPVSAIGGFVNYASGCVGICSPDQHYLMEVLDAAGTTLEFHDITLEAPISTPGEINGGAVRGIARSTNDITYLRLYNAANVLDDLMFSRVDTPSSPALLLIGLAAGCAARRRREPCDHQRQ